MKAKCMGADRNIRRFSLKELLGVMTWMAVAFALVRIGVVNESATLLLIGLSMMFIGVSAIAGFVFDGRLGMRGCVMAAMMFLLLSIISAVMLFITL